MWRFPVLRSDPVHRFSGIEALVNDMLAQALGHFDEHAEDTSGSESSGQARPNYPAPIFPSIDG